MGYFVGQAESDQKKHNKNKCELAVEEGLELNSLLEGHHSQPDSSVKLRSAIAERHSQQGTLGLPKL